MANSNNNSNTNNSDFIEEHVNKMIEGIKTFLNPQYGNTTTTPEEEAAAVTTINPAMKKHCNLQINIIQTAPRDAAKLREILRAKEEEYEKAQDSEDIDRLVTEIDMLIYLLFLVRRANETRNNSNVCTSIALIFFVT